MGKGNPGGQHQAAVKSCPHGSEFLDPLRERGRSTNYCRNVRVWHFSAVPTRQPMSEVRENGLNTDMPPRQSLTQSSASPVLEDSHSSSSIR